jgi:glycosyltransferase involved in cell wall biosynthesis
MLVFNRPERGTYWRAYYLARELCRRGHRATVIATAPQERRRFRVAYEQHGRLALVEAPDMLPGSLRSGWDPWAAWARAAWLRGSQIDLIHAFECRPSVILPALAARRRLGVPLVIDWCDLFGRGGSVEERPNPLVRAALRPVETFFETRFRTQADATTVINHELGARAAALGVDPASIALLPNGCDTAGWELEPREQARAALGLPAHAPLNGYVGAMLARDAALLARAFDALHAQRPDARLVVVGYCNIAVEQLVRDPSTVLRTGPLDTPALRRYLRACTLGWLPLSDSGANRGRWPLKISTYMEGGLPFVTTAIGDLGAFVACYPAGLAAEPSPASIAAQTVALLDDPARAEALGAAGRRLAESELSWASMADVVEDVYCRVLGRQMINQATRQPPVVSNSL